jgi:hypothetical protein
MLLSTEMLVTVLLMIRSPLACFLFVAIGFVFNAEARITKAWRDQEVFDKADLVVIAQVVATKDSDERSTILTHNVIGVLSEFKTQLILKGEKSIKSFQLHYYKLASKSDAQTIANGPALIEIPEGKHPTYLLFLMREGDGRYAPATDQTDPAAHSVLRLRGANGVQGEEPEPQVDEARSERRWDYLAMFEESELVVLAHWRSAQDTDERGILPNTKTKVVGVTTVFEATVVLKGPKDGNKIALHHYRFQEEGDAFRYFSPQLLRIIEPVNRDGRYSPGGGEFLLFLVRESDGRFAPVTGQTDPAISSVLRVVPGDS